MNLRDVLVLNHVIVPLAAQTLKGATEELAARLIGTGAVAEPNRFRAVLENAWPEDLVTVGEHAFLPHFRTEAVRALVAALGVATTPIPWERDPNRSARIVILVIAPPRESATYLQVMGAFARALSDPETARGLVEAGSPEDVVRLPAFSAIELPSHRVVRDVMVTTVVTVGPETDLGSAARLMVERGLAALPVVDDAGSLLGVVGEREVLRVLTPAYLQRTKSGEYRAPARTQLQRGSVPLDRLPVRDLMARSVLCLAEDQALGEAANVMNTKVADAFPVLRDGKVVGILTRADLIGQLIPL
jgi:CBS domain-containing protein/mannitol/fructose-specific phosphotransferase system IIA component (Ntr-type)